MVMADGGVRWREKLAGILGFSIARVLGWMWQTGEAFQKHGGHGGRRGRRRVGTTDEGGWTRMAFPLAADAVGGDWGTV